MAFNTAGYTLAEVAQSRQNFAWGYIHRVADDAPWMRVGDIWALANKAAEAAFPLPPSEDEAALWAQLADIEVN